MLCRKCCAGVTNLLREILKKDMKEMLENDKNVENEIPKIRIPRSTSRSLMKESET